MQNGVGWSLGNGTSVKFWMDNWANLHSRLCDMAITNVPDELITLEVCYFVDQKGDWDWRKFSSLLPKAALEHIAAILPKWSIHG